MSATAVSGFAAAHAEGDDWRALAAACAEELARGCADANLGFLYATDALAGDLGGIVALLRERTGIADWVGSVGAGVCGGTRESFGRPALAAMAAALPPDRFRVFKPLRSQAGIRDALPADWLSRTQPLVGIVHGDPRLAAITETIAALSREASLFLVGGLAAAEPPIQVAGQVVEGGLSGVLLAPEIAVVTGLTQGCSPIGPVRRVTEARDNILMSLDERPALEVLKEDLGELLSRDLRRIGGLIYAGFPVTGSDTGDYLVRNLIAIDVPRQWLAVAHPVAAGDVVLFCRRDPASAALDLERMLGQLKRRAGGTPRAGLYFSCVARGPNLFDEPSREIGMIREALGEFPLAGFFGNGEIAHDRLYGYTGVLALFV
jgi:small ligand-binding sensory domain FIST